MEYSILFIEPYAKKQSKPQVVTDFVKLLIQQVEQQGGKIHLNYDFVMLGKYDATIIAIVDYKHNLLPGSDSNLKVITNAFHNELDLLNHGLIKNIHGLKSKYKQNKKKVNYDHP